MKIELKSTNVNLDFNTNNDVENLDFILQKIIRCENEVELVEILNNTSYKYIFKIEQDGFINISRDSSKFSLISNATVVKEAVKKILKKGGYKKTYKKLNKKSLKNRIRYWIIYLIVGVLIFIIGYFVVEMIKSLRT